MLTLHVMIIIILIISTLESENTNVVAVTVNPYRALMPTTVASLCFLNLYKQMLKVKYVLNFDTRYGL